MGPTASTARGHESACPQISHFPGLRWKTHVFDSACEIAKRRNCSESSSGICPRPRSRRAAEPDNNPPHLGQAHHARAGQTHPGLATEREPRRAGVSNSGSPRARRQPTAHAVLNRARGAAYRPNGSPVRRIITSTSSRADRADLERAGGSQSADGRLSLGRDPRLSWRGSSCARIRPSRRARSPSACREAWSCPPMDRRAT